MVSIQCTKDQEEGTTRPHALRNVITAWFPVFVAGNLDILQSLTMVFCTLLRAKLLRLKICFSTVLSLTSNMASLRLDCP